MKMRIREATVNDIGSFVQLVQDNYPMTEAELISVYNQSSLMLTFDDLNIGFASIICYDQSNQIDKSVIKIYVNPAYRRNGYGSLLIKELEKKIQSMKKQQIKIDNIISEFDLASFAMKLGYDYWYRTHRMEYKGNIFEEILVCLDDYDERYYHSVSQLSADAFYQTRKDNDIEPYAIPESESDKEKLNKHKDEYKLLLRNQELIGVVKITNGNIALAAVGKKYRNKGYGTELIKYGVNTILSNGYDAVRLHVMDTNKDARRLYEQLGFVKVSTVEAYRKKL